MVAVGLWPWNWNWNWNWDLDWDWDLDWVWWMLWIFLSILSLIIITDHVLIQTFHQQRKYNTMASCLHIILALTYTVPWALFEVAFNSNSTFHHSLHSSPADPVPHILSALLIHISVSMLRVGINISSYTAFQLHPNHLCHSWLLHWISRMFLLWFPSMQVRHVTIPVGQSEHLVFTFLACKNTIQLCLLVCWLVFPHTHATGATGSCSATWIAPKSLPFSFLDGASRSNELDDKNPNVVLYFHGGGYVRGFTDMYLIAHLALVRATGTFGILSVDYPLAPDYPFPAALNHCHDSFSWLASRVGANHIIIAGDSAGGGLALVTAIRARETVSQCRTHAQCLLPLS
jgi:hypothetical protein